VPGQGLKGVACFHTREHIADAGMNPCPKPREQPTVTESLCGLREVADHGRVRPDLRREDRTEVHVSSS
jgi:hypothetical protein